MIDWGAVAAAISAIAVVVTLAIFIRAEKTRRAETTADSRHRAVARVLSVTEGALKRRRLPYPLSRWNDSKLEFALLALRLRHELSDKDKEVAVWVMRQTQLMLESKNDKEAILIAIVVATRLTEWDKELVRTSWFNSQNREDPPLAGFKVSSTRRVWQFSFQMRDALKSWLALAVFYVAGRKLFKQLRDF